MATQLRELFPLLRDKNSQVRALALENLLPYTPQGSPHRNLFFEHKEIISDLELLCRAQPNAAHDAFRALVNLSDSPHFILPLSAPAHLSFLVSYIINPNAILADLAAMLLSNLTSSERACSILLGLKIKVIPDDRLPGGVYTPDSRSDSCPSPVPLPSGEVKEVPALPLLIDAFVQGATIGDIRDLEKRKRKGELHFLASVFANLTASRRGRSDFLSPEPTDILQPTKSFIYPLSKLVAFTEHRDRIRRAGVSSTIKNCAFLATAHKAMLSPESEQISASEYNTKTAPGIDALPYILLPLAGPEEFDLDDQESLHPTLQFLPSTKTREPDSSIRYTHIETLLLLCHTRWGRDVLRSNGVYQIVRVMHENETVEKVQEAIERLVQLIKGDEPDASLDEVDDIAKIADEKKEEGEEEEEEVVNDDDVIEEI